MGASRSTASHTPAEEQTRNKRRSEAKQQLAEQSISCHQQPSRTKLTLRTGAWGWGQATALSSHRPPISKPEPTCVPRFFSSLLHRCDIPYPIFSSSWWVDEASELSKPDAQAPLFPSGMWEERHTRHHYLRENKRAGIFSKLGRKVGARAKKRDTSDTRGTGSAPSHPICSWRVH